MVAGSVRVLDACPTAIALKCALAAHNNIVIEFRILTPST
jgi:hypothetical protein